MYQDNKAAAYECQSTDFILMAEKRYKRYRELSKIKKITPPKAERVQVWLGVVFMICNTRVSTLPTTEDLFYN